MNIRDRIKELRRVRAGDLRPHPKNWRTHPEAQQNALRGMLVEVGYVDALIVRELPDGSLQIVDGHLRAETTPDALVPVLVVDLDDKEADKVLATFNPFGAMAELDEEQLAALLKPEESPPAHDRCTPKAQCQAGHPSIALSARFGPPLSSSGRIEPDDRSEFRVCSGVCRYYPADAQLARRLRPADNPADSIATATVHRLHVHRAGRHAGRNGFGDL